MADLVLDNFQDVVGTSLAQHAPDVNAYGEPWIEGTTQQSEIVQDPDIAENTILEVRGTIQQPVVIKVGTSGELECRSTARANNVGGNRTVALASRLLDNAGYNHAYTIQLDFDNNQVQLLKIVSNAITVLASSVITGSSDSYEDLFISSSSNAQLAKVESKNITLGPVTDTGVVPAETTGLYPSYTTTGAYFRNFEVSLPTFDVAVFDIANGADSSQLFSRNVILNDLGNGFDDTVPNDISVLVYESIIGNEITILNENQFRISDYGSIVEQIVIPTINLEVNDAVISNDALVTKVYFNALDSGVANDTKDPINTDITISDSGLTTQLLVLSFDIISQIDFIIPLLPRDNVGISVKTNDVIDLNISVIESVKSINLVTIAESLFSLSTINISGSNIVILDGTIGIEEPIIANQLPVIIDQLTGVAEIINVSHPIGIVELGLSQELPFITSQLISNDMAYANDQALISQLINIYDFGITVDLVTILHFEIQQVFDNINGNDSLLVLNDLNVEDFGNSVEMFNNIVSTALDDNANLTEIVSVLGSFGKRVTDTGVMISDNVVVGYIKINDNGSVVETLSLSGNVVSISDNGKVDDLIFNYDDKQQLIHILFTIKVPRILFLLNTKEEFDNETS